MGCVYSRVEREEAVRRCRERRRLMKHLVGCRARFAAAHLAYLQSLRNTGATLRQFAEADSSIAPGDAASVTTAGGRRIRPPPSPPPPPLPPSPPPLPPFSPEEEARGFPFPPGERRICREQEETTVGDDSDADETRPPPPPPPPENGAGWGLWDPFDSSPPVLASPVAHQNAAAANATGAPPPAMEEEDWEETKTEFDDEEIRAENPIAAAASIGAEAVGLGMVIKGKLLPGRGDVVADDDSSAVSSWFTKETDSSMVLWRSRRSLAGIVRDLDDYFLKASAGGTKVAALLESHRGCSLHQLFEETEGKNFKSAKVFSSLSWRWSLRSPPSGGPDCPPGAAPSARQPGRHSTTLDRLLADEQKLYKEVKEEERRKLEFGKKVALLRKQEAGGQDWTITARTRSSMEELQMEIVSLQESIARTCSSISKLRDEELHPQLVELCSGFMEMWRTMYQCHQVQNHIAQQMNHLHGHSAAEPTTESHIQAASQLEAEVDKWHSSLHGLLRAQREYAHTLNQWVRLTDCLPAASEGAVGPCRIFRLCEEWQLALDRLPEKVPAEAIKSFISIVQSISSQLAEEHRHQKRSSRLEKRVMRELDSPDGDGDAGGAVVSVAAAAVNPPAESVRRAKMAARRRRAEEEKTRYMSWKPLRALSHIRHRRFNCMFTLHVHSVDGLPPSFNGTALCVRWKRNIAELGLCTRHGQVSHGVAKFEETLEHRCAVYGSRSGGPHHTAKYEARQFILYASVVGAPEVDLGKHRVDLTRLLPLTLEELEKGSTGKWSTSFKLSGKGRHASLNVSFGFSVLDGGDLAESGGRRKVSELPTVEPEDMVRLTDRQFSLKKVGSLPVPKLSPKSQSDLPSRSVEDVSVLNEALPISRSELVGLDDVDHLSADEKIDENEAENLVDNITSELQVSTPQYESPVLTSGPLMEPGKRDVEGPDYHEFTVVEQGIEIAAETGVEGDMVEHDEHGVVYNGDAGDSRNDVEENDASLSASKGDGHNAPEYLAQLFASDGELPVHNSSHQAESMSDSELILEELESALDNLSIFESEEFRAQNAEEESLEEPCYMDTSSNDGMGRMSRTPSLDDITDTVASEFLSMLGIEDCPFEFGSDSDPESPRERLWQQFKNESLVDVESIFGLEMEGGTELDWCDYSDDFDLSSMVHAAETEHQKATQALESKTRAQMLEHAEAEALMHELGLDENSFHNSPPGGMSGVGGPRDLPSEEPLDLPPLSEGLGPFVQTKDGGFLRSMNPSLFRNSQHNGSLIMQVSSPVVVPAEMGSSAMEILQCLASVGIEKLSMQASKLMPLEDITGKTIQQVAWEALPAMGMQERQDLSQNMMPEAEPGLGKGTDGKKKGGASSILSSSRKVGHDYVSLEDLAPLAMEKIEALSIEGLRIQSGMSDKDAPANIRPHSIGEISALEGKEATNCMSLGLDGAAGLQLLDINDCADEVDGLMGLSITLDEWMKLDSGIIDEDQISDRTSKILAAHHATSTEMVPGGCKGDRRGRNSGRKWGLLGNNFTVALMVQLRDPLRNYEPVGTPMLSLIQVERVFVPPKPRIYCTVSDGGNSEQAEEPEATAKAAETKKEEEEAVLPQFKITGVHVAGLKTDPGKRKIWGGSNQQQSGSRWLLANGMGKANKHPLMKSKPSQAGTSQHNAKAQPGETLWSVSSRVHGKGSKWKELPSLNPHKRNPNIILPTEPTRLQ